MKKRPIIITSTNAFTIPKMVRNLLDLQPGDCLDYEVMANGSIILVRKECCKRIKFLLGWEFVPIQKKSSPETCGNDNYYRALSFNILLTMSNIEVLHNTNRGFPRYNG